MPDTGASGSGVGSPARIDRQADAGGRSARRIRGIPRGGTRAVVDERSADRSGSRLHPRARTPERGCVRICVVGAGAGGGGTGAWLARAGQEVSFVARGAHLEAIQRRGLTLISGGRPEVHPLRASSEPADFGIQDAVFICLKAYSIAAMLPRLATLVGAETVVIPAINGLPWWYFYKEGGRFDALDPKHVLGCVVHAAAEVAEPGVVRHTAGRVFLIGEPDRTQSARVVRLVAAMNAAGFEARQVDDIRREIWVKLIGNLSYNPVAGLALAHMNDIHGNQALLALIRQVMEEAM